MKYNCNINVFENFHVINLKIFDLSDTRHRHEMDESSYLL